MTEKLYEKNSYIKEFTATVKSCEHDNGVYNVILDKTAFAPEGGGQKADVGFIDEIAVIDVVEKGDDIIHKVVGEIKNREVFCRVDFDKRFEKMQNHTGEHIVSGVIKREFGFNNVGFHLGEEVVTLDVDGVLTANDVAKIERESNLVVYENKSVNVSYPTLEVQESLDFRSKISCRQGLRLVEIEDTDLCACCAPHVSTTGQVGNIKILSFSSHRGGTRLLMVCGEYAVKYLQKVNGILDNVYKSFSANAENVIEKISLIKEENQKQRVEIQNLKNQIVLSSLKIIEKGDLIFAQTENATFDSLRFSLNTLLEKGKAVLIISKTDDGLLYMLSSHDNKAQEMFNALKEVVIVKGGLRNNFSQGKIEGRVEDIEKIIIKN